VLLRHDRPDTACLVDEAAWPAVVTFFDGDGAGTLVADRWILTAAHTADNIPAEHRVGVGGRRLAIAEIVRPPDGVDLALLRLAEPASVAPLTIHERRDEIGAVVLLLGRGDFGNGRDGVLGADGRLRCVTNRIDDADERWLRFRFDRPPDCTALEGVGGEGDSGGPALIRTGEQLTVAGVSSWQDHDGPLGAYGCVEHYARVATHVSWIRAVIASDS
jgi:hypothetical protein